MEVSVESERRDGWETGFGPSGKNRSSDRRAGRSFSILFSSCSPRGHVGDRFS